MNSSVLRILVIEDNPGDARLIAALLSVARTARFEVESAETLAIGTQTLLAETFDAVISRSKSARQPRPEDIPRSAASGPECACRGLERYG